MNTTEWKRGIGSGTSWKAEISGRMNTKDKSDWANIDDYEKDALAYYGCGYEVKCFEYANHYAVKFRRKELNIPTYSEDFQL